MLDGHTILLGHVDGTKTTHLGSQDLALLRCGCTTNDGIVTIKVLRDLLKGSVTGFDVELPDDEELEAEPAAVDDVVLPLDGTESDGVDVLVEDEGDVDGQVHDDQTLGSDSEGQDLDGVGDEQGGHGQVVEGVVLRESECDLSLAKVSGPTREEPDYSR